LTVPLAAVYGQLIYVLQAIITYILWSNWTHKFWI